MKTLEPGSRIQEKYTNLLGTVTKVVPGSHMLVQWDNGIQDMVHINYMKHIVKLESEPVVPLETVEVMQQA